MKSGLRIIVAIFTIAICTAFTAPVDNGLSVTYGVAASDPSQIELKLNKDFTFTYQDFSHQSQEIKVEGTYELKNNKVLLIAKNDEVSFHDKWKITADGTRAKSRKGLSFYTLGKK